MQPDDIRQRLLGILKIRPDEVWMVALVTGVMLATAAGSSIGSNSVDALFFARFGVQYLPYMYVALGGATFAITIVFSALLGRISHRMIFGFFPLLVGLILLAERAALVLDLSWLYPLIWLSKEVMNSLLGLVTWGLAGLLADTRQAKRLFPLFTAGSIAGTVLGAFGTAPLVAWFHAENMLLVWAAALVATFVLARLVLARGARSAPRRASRRVVRGVKQAGWLEEIQQGLASVRRSPLLAWASVASVLFSVLFFSLALPFSKAATAQFPTEDALAGFLGLFQGISTLAALLASLFLANRLYARFGIMTVVLSFPLVYLSGFGALLFYAAFPVLVVFKFVQMIWLSGLADSAWQAMFNVVPPERRDKGRAFVSGIAGQAGILIAGLILITGEQALPSRALYAIGLVAAAATVFAMWRARQAYAGALVEALRAGQPLVFFPEEEPFGGFRRDAAALQAAIAGMSNPDPALRRTSSVILGHLPAPEAAGALVGGLYDDDPEVRAASLGGLARAGAAPALLEVADRLHDPEPQVRLRAIEALPRLAGYPSALLQRLRPALDDPDPVARTQAAVEILHLGPDPTAWSILQTMAVGESLEARAAALDALGQWGHVDACDLVMAGLRDPSPAVRRTAATALGRFQPDGRTSGPAPLEALIRALGDEDRSVREAAAAAMGRFGSAALQAVLAALDVPELEDGALAALRHLPARPIAGPLHEYAARRVQVALRYEDARRALSGKDEGGRIQPGSTRSARRRGEGEARNRVAPGFMAEPRFAVRHRSSVILSEAPPDLLLDSLLSAARRNAVYAIRAAGLLADPETTEIAVENLASQDPAQRANAIETLESSPGAALIRPVLRLWDDGSTPDPPLGDPAAALLALLADPDAWLRASAALAAGPLDLPGVPDGLRQLADSDPDPLVRESASVSLRGGGMTDTLPTLSVIERILFLRRVTLFAGLDPGDLKRIAAIAVESSYPDGETIVYQDDPGNEMFVIVAGQVLVQQKDAAGQPVEVARRGPGEVVGEMSIIDRAPRMASLVAVGEVRTLSIGQKQFEGLLRERPETSLAVMRVLCARLREASRSAPASEPAHTDSLPSPGAGTR